jgi:hypothetical protein
MKALTMVGGGLLLGTGRRLVEPAMRRESYSIPGTQGFVERGT